MGFRFFYRRELAHALCFVDEDDANSGAPLNSQSAIIRTQNNDCWGRTTDPPLYNAAS